MRVRARFWLLGAVLPAAGLLCATLLAGQLFRISLVRALDQQLRAQAAVEGYSLFDGPSGEPHLVLTPAQIAAAQSFASLGVVAVYDARGVPVIRFPEGAFVPPTLAPEDPPSAPPRLATVVEGETPVRELRRTVAARDGRLYLLRLATPLASVAATMRVFYQVTLSVCAALAAILLAVQGLAAGRLAARIRVMTAHLPHLREGDFGARIPPDETADEIAELRTALAEVSDRLARARDAQDRLIANAAHELRTPLTVMRTEMDLALRRERTPAELREALVDVRHEVDRLAHLATNLLDLAARGRAKLDLRPGDLAELVRAAADWFRGEAASRGITIEVDAPARAEAWFDPAGVRQAVDNYLSNALKFAPAGSRVTVSLAPGEDRFALAVIDEGPGVPEAAREIVFEPFFRADKATPGAGLGLAIVREIARKHGGSAFVRPASPRGACFVIELPGNAPAAGMEPPAAAI